MDHGFNEKDENGFLKIYKSNKYKSKEEDAKSGIEDAVARLSLFKTRYVKTVVFYKVYILKKDYIES